MHSWGMFNAYHSAFLGVRGIMALLGIGFPRFAESGQFFIDVHPAPATNKQKKQLIAGQYLFRDFSMIKLSNQVDHEDTWTAFIRTLNVSKVPCWEERESKELRDLAVKSISEASQCVPLTLQLIGR